MPGGEDDVEESRVEDDAEGDEGEVDGEQQPVQLRGHLAVVVDLLHLLQANKQHGWKGESAVSNSGSDLLSCRKVSAFQMGVLL